MQKPAGCPGGSPQSLEEADGANSRNSPENDGRQLDQKADAVRAGFPEPSVARRMAFDIEFFTLKPTPQFGPLGLGCLPAFDQAFEAIRQICRVVKAGFWRCRGEPRRLANGSTKRKWGCSADASERCCSNVGASLRYANGGDIEVAIGAPIRDLIWTRISRGANALRT